MPAFKEPVALPEGPRGPVRCDHTLVSFTTACWEQESAASRGDCCKKKERKKESERKPSHGGLCVHSLSKLLWSAALHSFKVPARSTDAKLATMGSVGGLKVHLVRGRRIHRQTGVKAVRGITCTSISQRGVGVSRKQGKQGHTSARPSSPRTPSGDEKKKLPSVHNLI